MAPKEVSTLEIDGFQQMYEKAGLLTTSDGSISILAGSSLGGGTTVNWACCIPLPPMVRQEWSMAPISLPQFAPVVADRKKKGNSRAPNHPKEEEDEDAEEERGSEFEASLAAVWARIGCSSSWASASKSSLSLASSSSSPSSTSSSISEDEDKDKGKVGKAKTKDDEKMVHHDAANQVLLEGCGRLGMEARTAAQNLKDTKVIAACKCCCL